MSPHFVVLSFMWVGYAVCAGEVDVSPHFVVLSFMWVGYAVCAGVGTFLSADFF